MTETETAFERARRHGFTRQGGVPCEQPARAKPRSHDDGPDNGPFLGGLGTAVFSRGLDGRFDRWQLQSGLHLHQPIDAAFFAIAWTRDGERHYKRLTLGEAEHELPATSQRYAALFPRVFEVYDHPDLPGRITLDYYSPVIPGDAEAAAAPVTLFSLSVTDWRPGVSEVSVALCWPNLVGWQLSPLTTVERAGRHWPNQSHAGQWCRLAEQGDGEVHLVQGQRRFERSDMSGQVVVSARSDSAALSFRASSKANQNATGVPDRQQRWTLAELEERLHRDGQLDNDATTWSAHWHEPLVSAACARLDGPGAGVTFALTLDLPLTRFGQGRLWRKAYTRDWGAGAEHSLALARHALDSDAGWRAAIDRWQTAALAELTPRLAERTAGALVNELNLVTGLGTAWLAGPDRPLADDERHFRRTDHFGLLEGFDSGYYYYNTLDLWVYAFAALSRHWPDLAESVFGDYLDSVDLVLAERRPVYRSARLEPLLAPAKVPHDLGSAMADPWVALNGYVMRDDPNVWKDHNPAFIVSFYLHRRLTGRAISPTEYGVLSRAADFILAQDGEGLGMPRHGDFGDSTWDNLDMRGLSAYAGGFALAGWAVMARLAREQGETARAALFEDRLARGQATFETLWRGDAYRTNSEGKYRDATMADALIGILYARRAGLGDLLPAERVRRHLATTVANNADAYQDGAVGPLLVAEPRRQHYPGDGGEELQVNEVLVGSAWILVALLGDYGLNDEAEWLAGALTDHLYRRSGLQFRTPAAWDGEGRFRAPLNLRPLSIWWLATP